MSQTTTAATGNSKKKPILFILIGLLSISTGIGGTWYIMKDQNGEAETTVLEEKKPITFIKLETFTVNLQSEDHEQHRYLQIELAVKVSETKVIDMIKEKMPEIRNHVLLLLSSKNATEISNFEGKQQLSQDIAEAIRLKVEHEMLQEDIQDVLFTSFIIQ
jgi:flagellar protein FliL